MNSKNGWIKASSTLLGSLADLLWPPVCAVCSRLLPLAENGAGGERHFCRRCLEAVEFMPASLCGICGRPFYSSPEHVCGDCLASPPLYRQARSALVYQGAVARSISLLKYYGDLSQLKVLADLARPLAGSLMEEGGFEVVIPMPVSDGRYRERGFNQAQELAGDLYAPWKERINPAALRRPGNENTHQASLSAKSRAKAIKGCFAVDEPGHIQGARILLFDDVFTTGATASEAVATLLKAGAASVDIFTLARTVLASWR